jgi:hypothetical protein
MLLLFDDLGDTGLEVQTENIFDPAANIRMILGVGLPCERPVPDAEGPPFCFEQLRSAPIVPRALPA